MNRLRNDNIICKNGKYDILNPVLKYGPCSDLFISQNIKLTIDPIVLLQVSKPCVLFITICIKRRCVKYKGCF
jgi:hypothetical protein